MGRDEQPGGWPPDWFTKEPGFVGQLPGAAPGTSDPGSDDGRQITFQIKMLQPADIQASVALRSEGAPAVLMFGCACVAK